MNWQDECINENVMICDSVEVRSKKEVATLIVSATAAFVDVDGIC